MSHPADDAATQWWRNAVIYQVYPRSFADSDGDGLGDIAGICSRLDHLSWLGVDAIWITPWYPSPQADGGYDVTDYRAVAPEFGTLDDAERLIREAHERDIRVVLDVVPNHSSSEHPWFVEALRSPAGDPARSRYHFADGRGPGGSEPPNDWTSQFGGPAWTRVGDGQWYLHQFAPEQPDLNWNSPDVREDFARTLRFWFDRGVDGFRIDVATALIKAPGLPDLGFVDDSFLAEVRMDDHPYRDRDEVHEIYREWRKIADSYPDPKLLIAEAWLERPHRLSRYLRPDELHLAFGVPFLRAPWEAAGLADAIEQTLAAVDPVQTAPSWVLENHDMERLVTRFGRERTGQPRGVDPASLGPVDEARGERRARAAAVLLLSLPGCVYLYQGEELGLPNAPIPDEAIQDPIWLRSGRQRRGRDGCRVPLPWTTSPDRGFGFGSDDPWLPQPPGWGRYSVAAQRTDAGSFLTLHQKLITHHRRLHSLPLTVETAGSLLLVRRGARHVCVVNTGSKPESVEADFLGIGAPEHLTVLAGSDLSSCALGRTIAVGPDCALLLEGQDSSSWT